MSVQVSNRLSDPEITSALNSLRGWSLNIEKQQIEKTYDRGNFVNGAGFIQKIADLAERHDHHPDVLLSDYKNVRVMLSTHSAGGLTLKDFEVAKEIDGIV